MDIHGGNIWDAARRRGVAPSELIDFSASINPFGPPEGVVRALKESGALLSPYPEPYASGLVRAVSERHGLDEECVLAANGSTELIYLLPRALAPGRALIVEPAFSEYRKALDAAGCRVSSLLLKEEDGFTLPAGRLEKALSRGFDIVFLANPANPTGVLMERGEVIQAARACKRAGALLVVDEAFMDFCGEEASVTGEAGRGGLMVLRSLTKFFSIAGLRAGYAVGGKGLIKRLKRHLPPWSVNTLASIASVEALKDEGFASRSRTELRAEREYLSEGLSRIKGVEVFPGAANYLMLKTGSKAVTERLFEKGILIRDLSSFRSLGPGFFRVAVLKREDNARLIAALKPAIERPLAFKGRP